MKQEWNLKKDDKLDDAQAMLKLEKLYLLNKM